MMECDQWLLKVYGGRIERLVMPFIEGDDLSTLATTMLSLLGRRPGLSHVIIQTDEGVEVLVEAMRRGYINQLQRLRVEGDGREDEEVVYIGALYDALADGLCPKINTLELCLDSTDDDRQPVPSLSDAMRSRMEEDKGCCGLKSLVAHGYGIINTLPILSSGACEALEELSVNKSISLSDQAATDLSEWLSRTKAPKLRILKINLTPIDAMASLCSASVAPRLQTLHLAVEEGDSMSLLSQAIGRGAWPNLSEMALVLANTNDGDAQFEALRGMVPGLMEAIGQGAQKLKVLSAGCGRGMLAPEGGMALARMLGDGGCRQLEKLDLRSSGVDDDAMVELARALEGGAPCRITLRWLDLPDNDIGGAGVRALAEAMEAGALPHLEYLDLSTNSDIKDHGVVALAMTMTTRRVLLCLQTLDLGGVGMTEIGAWVMFEAFRHHKPCPHLKTLRISYNREIGDDGVVRLANAIEAGAFQHLENMHIPHVGMMGEGFRAVIKAIVAQQPNPGCPRLKVLDVRGNSLGDEGMVHLSEAIKMKGAMQCLQEIQLYGVVGVGDVGAMAVLDALTQSHVCPSLQWMMLTLDAELDDNEGGKSCSAEVTSLQAAVMTMRKGLRIYFA